jgi:uncharacterized protein YbcI
MKTRGEIEAAVSDGMTCFEQEYLGRGPKHIRTHLLGDLLVVRLQGVLTSAEQQLVKVAAPEKGRNLLKQVRTELVEMARPLLEAMVAEATGGRSSAGRHARDAPMGRPLPYGASSPMTTSYSGERPAPARKGWRGGMTRGMPSTGRVLYQTLTGASTARLLRSCPDSAMPLSST